jgi:predicted nucleic acid-binding protein
MTHGKYILDTNAAIDLLNGKQLSPALDAELFRAKRYISVMTEKVATGRKKDIPDG